MTTLVRRSGVLLFLAVFAVAAPATAQDEQPDVATRTIRIESSPPDQQSDPVVVDRLDPTTVLIVEASGFGSDITGGVQQCSIGPTRVCRNHVPVRFDQNGHAVFQFLITDDGGCRLVDDRCILELTAGTRRTVVDTVFVDAVPDPGRLTVSPDHDLRTGDTVTVSASGFPSDVTLIATVCAAPSTRGSRCGLPAPEVMLVTDASGAASAAMMLDVEEVGSDGITCGGVAVCHVVVMADEPGVRASPVGLEFLDAPPTTYDGTRVVVGLLTAVLLLTASVLLIRRTDWRPSSELDSSAIDEAEYADLDAEVERFDDVSI